MSELLPRLFEAPRALAVWVGQWRERWPRMLMWLNDHPLDWLLMARASRWWLPRQPWHWLSGRICEYHHRKLPDEWVLSKGPDPFWMRRG